MYTKQDKEKKQPKTETVEKTETKRKTSIDRPTEPTYPWRKPSNADDEVDFFPFFHKLFSFKYYFWFN